LHVYEVEQDRKLSLLEKMLKEERGSFLVFARTKHGADRLAKKLAAAYLANALVEIAWSASRTKQSEFQERYQRLKQRIGHKRALVACAHALVLRIYEVLDTGTSYQSRGGNLNPRSVERLIHHHARRLKCRSKWRAKENSDSEA
jgi:superfamily II DNA/RNA helicase